MGTFLNPGNEGFAAILSKTYVDKTGLIGVLNKAVSSPDMLTCVSRPRRFGKSYATHMLCAYYDKGCDSDGLFSGLEISKAASYKDHLNKYNVIILDMAALIQEAGDEDLAEYTRKMIRREVYEAWPEARDDESFSGMLAKAAEISGTKFVMIMDEWDAPIRELPGYEMQYLKFLRMIFKNTVTTQKTFAMVYMTGILPIKKDGSQSALSDFHEYTMLDPGSHVPYFGFTSDEVKMLCKKYDKDFGEIKRWYDGYTFDENADIYNPNSVIKAVTTGKLKSYWTQTSAIDSLIHYIGMDFDGLSKTVAELTGGSEVSLNVNMFDNDLTSFRNKDSVLTLLIHLGYLTYNDKTGKARIPNEEIRIEFSDKIKEVKKEETIKRVAESARLITDTVRMDSDKVAAQIEKIHEEEAASLFYNNEQALRGIIKLAYFAYKDYYMSFEELPAGAGFADIVYFPKKDATLPALLIDLKWNKTAVGAIDQIKNKHYPDAIKDYGGEVLLVGINYDKDAPAGERKHSCVIEKMEL